jgi:hypothetical protein
MGSKELRRAGVLARVESGELKLVDGAVLIGMSYRQSKRLAKRYREGGTQGLKHGSAGRVSNRRKSKKFRERVLRLVGKKYSPARGGAGDAIWADVPAAGDRRIIAANSPQAKGRVERNHGTHQDRLVKKMRLKKIKTYAEANRFLEKEYLPEQNPGAARGLSSSAPRGRRSLEDVFHLETGRILGNDWVVRHPTTATSR